MTWHAFFDMSTMEERHLVASYSVVLLLQGGYFVWMLRNWRLSRRSRS